jgi:hypothetical protein
MQRFVLTTTMARLPILSLSLSDSEEYMDYIEKWRPFTCLCSELCSGQRRLVHLLGVRALLISGCSVHLRGALERMVKFVILDDDSTKDIDANASLNRVVGHGII